MTYPLTEILFVGFVGVPCDIEDMDEIALFARMNLEWFRRFMAFGNGTAPAQTIRPAFKGAGSPSL